MKLVLFVLILNLLGGCTLVKYRKYTLDGKLIQEIIVKKSRKMVIKNYVTETRIITTGKDSCRIEEDSCFSYKAFYVDSFLYKDIGQDCHGNMKIKSKIRLHVEQPEIMSSGDTFVFISRYGRITQFNNHNKKESVRFRFGMVKLVSYENNKKLVRRYRLKKMINYNKKPK